METFILIMACILVTGITFFVLMFGIALSYVLYKELRDYMESEREIKKLDKQIEDEE